MNELPVMPIGNIQKTDIRDEHMLGYFRVCASYKDEERIEQGDKFPIFASELFGKAPSYWNYHLIVQLQGCPLKCPYCYVDDDGIYGLKPNYLTPKQLIGKVKEIIDTDSRLHVFHLMGGAPALYIDKWLEIIDCMYEKDLSNTIFHSDIILVEPDLRSDFFKHLREIKNTKNHLIALCLKGISEDNFEDNAGIDGRVFNDCINNLYKILSTDINYYITLINPDVQKLPDFLDGLSRMWGDKILNRMQIIKIKPFNVTKDRYNKLFSKPESEFKKLDDNYDQAMNILKQFSQKPQPAMQGTGPNLLNLYKR